MIRLIPAIADDVPAIACLIERSVHGLQAEHYSQTQREGALLGAFGVDRQLIADRTYLLAHRNGMLAGCGGWSRRATLYGSDTAAVRDARPLDPASEPARIRAFFVDPDHARHGVGRAILEACTASAAKEGFTALELMATLAGVPFYAAQRFARLGEERAPLPDGATLPLVRMGRRIA